MESASAPAGEEFRLLGPVEVWRAGRPVPLGGERQRALLALLLLHANELVSSDRLIDELFGARSPRTPANAIQAAISRLRRALEDESGEPVIITRPSGYLLRAAPEQVDLTRFEKLLDDGRSALAADDPSRAAVILREALGLWRGPPLADLGSEEFAERERRRLDELRLAAIVERVEADLAAGADAELVGELEALVRAHPLHQRLRAQLMLALYRSGREGEALQAYQDAREMLVGELGIEPGHDLRRLQQAILNQDPDLDVVRQRTRNGSMQSVVVGHTGETRAG